MGNGSFHYECSGANGDDVACEGWSSGGVPDPIGVGAQFVVSFSPHHDQLEAGQSAEEICVVPASPSHVVQNGLTFTLLEVGQSSLLAMSPTGTVIDYLHVNGRNVDGLDLFSGTTTDLDPLVLAQGEIAWLVAEPETRSGVELAGRFHYDWASADPTIVSLEPGSHSRRMGLRGGEEGVTTVEVTAGGGARNLTVRVEAQP